MMNSLQIEHAENLGSNVQSRTSVESRTSVQSRADALSGSNVLSRSASSLLATALLLFAAGFLTSVNDPNAPGLDGDSSSESTSAGGGGDDETVGTLPISGAGDTLVVLRAARITRPSLYIQGSVDEVLSNAVFARGDRRVLAQPMSNGELRLVFLGDAQVGFDRNGFQAANLRVGVVVPQGASILRSGAAWNGQALSTWTYVYELPIAQFEANGLLDQAPVLAGISTSQGSTSVRAHASFDAVVLTQRR